MIIPRIADIIHKYAADCARSITVAAGCIGLALMSGCSIGGMANDGGPNQVFILKETPSPHQIVVKQGALHPTANVIEVNGLTPPPQKEMVGQPPSKKHVWMAGNWRFYNGRYVWIKGQWALPPEPNTVYTPPQWEIINGNSMFTEGYWHY